MDPDAYTFHKLPRTAAGTDFQAGKLSVSKKDFLHEFRAAGLFTLRGRFA